MNFRQFTRAAIAFFCSLLLIAQVVPQSCIVPANGAVVKTTSYSALAADAGKLIVMNCASACTLTLPATPQTPVWLIFVETIGAGQVTIAPNGLNLNGSASSLAMPLTAGSTFQVWTDNSNYFAAGVTLKTRVLGWAFGDVATGAALTTNEVGYITVPFACTITGWHIMADAGTVTIKTARVNSGTALPTIGSNSISTSGVSLASGTKIDSTTVTDFTSTAIAANDTLGFFITTVATAKQITFQLDCSQ
jgi:hypothetical protein